MNILLTSCISPGNSLKKDHHLPASRLLDLIYTLGTIVNVFKNHLIRSEYQIEVIDNSSGTDTAKYRYLLEQFSYELDSSVLLTFVDPDMPSIPKGKGYQEYLMIKKSRSWMNNSPLLKLSGRYTFSNIDKIIMECFASNKSICMHNIKRRLTASSIFYLAGSDKLDALNSPRFAGINDSSNYFFEHALYDSLLRLRTRPFKNKPRIISTFRSGESNNTCYPNSTLKRLSLSLSTRIYDFHPVLIRNAASYF